MLVPLGDMVLTVCSEMELVWGAVVVLTFPLDVELDPDMEVVLAVCTEVVLVSLVNLVMALVPAEERDLSRNCALVGGV